VVLVVSGGGESGGSNLPFTMINLSRSKRSQAIFKSYIPFQNLRILNGGIWSGELVPYTTFRKFTDDMVRRTSSIPPFRKFTDTFRVCNGKLEFESVCNGKLEFEANEQGAQPKLPTGRRVCSDECAVMGDSRRRHSGAARLHAWFTQCLLTSS
jgi:hypothetical protein